MSYNDKVIALAYEKGAAALRAKDATDRKLEQKELQDEAENALNRVAAFDLKKAAKIKMDLDRWNSRGRKTDPMPKKFESNHNEKLHPAVEELDLRDFKNYKKKNKLADEDLDLRDFKNQVIKGGYGYSVIRKETNEELLFWVNRVKEYLTRTFELSEQRQGGRIQYVQVSLDDDTVAILKRRLIADTAGKEPRDKRDETEEEKADDLKKLEKNVKLVEKFVGVYRSETINGKRFLKQIDGKNYFYYDNNTDYWNLYDPKDKTSLFRSVQKNLASPVDVSDWHVFTPPRDLSLTSALKVTFTVPEGKPIDTITGEVLGETLRKRLMAIENLRKHMMAINMPMRLLNAIEKERLQKIEAILKKGGGDIFKKIEAVDKESAISFNAIPTTVLKCDGKFCKGFSDELIQKGLSVLRTGERVTIEEDEIDLSVDEEKKRKELIEQNRLLNDFKSRKEKVKSKETNVQVWNDTFKRIEQNAEEISPGVLQDYSKSYNQCFSKDWINWGLKIPFFENVEKMTEVLRAETNREELLEESDVSNPWEHMRNMLEIESKFNPLIIPRLRHGKFLCINVAKVILENDFYALDPQAYRRMGIDVRFEKPSEVFTYDYTSAAESYKKVNEKVPTQLLLTRSQIQLNPIRNLLLKRAIDRNKMREQYIMSMLFYRKNKSFRTENNELINPYDETEIEKMNEWIQLSQINDQRVISSNAVKRFEQFESVTPDLRFIYGKNNLEISGKFFNPRTRLRATAHDFATFNFDNMSREELAPEEVIRLATRFFTGPNGIKEETLYLNVPFIQLDVQNDLNSLLKEVAAKLSEMDDKGIAHVVENMPQQHPGAPAQKIYFRRDNTILNGKYYIDLRRISLEKNGMDLLRDMLHYIDTYNPLKNFDDYDLLKVSWPPEYKYEKAASSGDKQLDAILNQYRKRVVKELRNTDDESMHKFLHNRFIDYRKPITENAVKVVNSNNAAIIMPDHSRIMPDFIGPLDDEMPDPDPEGAKKFVGSKIGTNTREYINEAKKGTREKVAYELDIKRFSLKNLKELLQLITQYRTRVEVDKLTNIRNRKIGALENYYKIQEEIEDIKGNSPEDEEKRKELRKRLGKRRREENRLYKPTEDGSINEIADRLRDLSLSEPDNSLEKLFDLLDKEEADEVIANLSKTQSKQFIQKRDQYGNKLIKPIIHFADIEQNQEAYTDIRNLIEKMIKKAKIEEIDSFATVLMHNRYVSDKDLEEIANKFGELPLEAFTYHSKRIQGHLVFQAKRELGSKDAEAVDKMENYATGISDLKFKALWLDTKDQEKRLAIQDYALRPDVIHALDPPVTHDELWSFQIGIAEVFYRIHRLNWTLADVFERFIFISDELSIVSAAPPTREWTKQRLRELETSFDQTHSMLQKLIEQVQGDILKHVRAMDYLYLFKIDSKLVRRAIEYMVRTGFTYQPFDERIMICAKSPIRPTISSTYTESESETSESIRKKYANDLNPISKLLLVKLNAEILTVTAKMQTEMSINKKKATTSFLDPYERYKRIASRQNARLSNFKGEPSHKLKIEQDVIKKIFTIAEEDEKIPSLRTKSVDDTIFNESMIERGHGMWNPVGVPHIIHFIDKSRFAHTLTQNLLLDDFLAQAVKKGYLKPEHVQKVIIKNRHKWLSDNDLHADYLKKDNARNKTKLKLAKEEASQRQRLTPFHTIFLQFNKGEKRWEEYPDELWKTGYKKGTDDERRKWHEESTAKKREINGGGDDPSRIDPRVNLFKLFADYDVHQKMRAKINEKYAEERKLIEKNSKAMNKSPTQNSYQKIIDIKKSTRDTLKKEYEDTIKTIYARDNQYIFKDISDKELKDELDSVPAKLVHIDENGGRASYSRYRRTGNFKRTKTPKLRINRDWRQDIEDEEEGDDSTAAMKKEVKAYTKNVISQIIPQGGIRPESDPPEYKYGDVWMTEEEIENLLLQQVKRIQLEGDILKIRKKIDKYKIMRIRLALCDGGARANDVSKDIQNVIRAQIETVKPPKDGGPPPPSSSPSPPDKPVWHYDSEPPKDDAEYEDVEKLKLDRNKLALLEMAEQPHKFLPSAPPYLHYVPEPEPPKYGPVHNIKRWGSVTPVTPNDEPPLVKKTPGILRNLGIKDPKVRMMVNSEGTVFFQRFDETLQKWIGAEPPPKETVEPPPKETAEPPPKKTLMNREAIAVDRPKRVQKRADSIRAKAAAADALWAPGSLDVRLPGKDEDWESVQRNLQKWAEMEKKKAEREKKRAEEEKRRLAEEEEKHNIRTKDDTEYWKERHAALYKKKGGSQPRERRKRKKARKEPRAKQTALARQRVFKYKTRWVENAEDWELHTVPGDGNCFYHSVAKYLNEIKKIAGPEVTAMGIRQEILNHAVLFPDSDEHNTKEEMLARIRGGIDAEVNEQPIGPEYYAQEPEILLTALVYDLCFQIYSTEIGEIGEWLEYTIPPGEDCTGDSVTLHYKGNNHYDLLERKGSALEEDEVDHAADKRKAERVARGHEAARKVDELIKQQRDALKALAEYKKRQRLVLTKKMTLLPPSKRDGPEVVNLDDSEDESAKEAKTPKSQDVPRKTIYDKEEQKTIQIKLTDEQEEELNRYHDVDLSPEELKNKQDVDNEDNAEPQKLYRLYDILRRKELTLEKILHDDASKKFSKRTPRKYDLFDEDGKKRLYSRKKPLKGPQIVSDKTLINQLSFLAKFRKKKKFKPGKGVKRDSDDDGGAPKKSKKKKSKKKKGEDDDDELKFIKAKGRSFWSDDDDELGPKKAKKKTPKKKARKGPRPPYPPPEEAVEEDEPDEAAPPAAEPAEPPAAEPAEPPAAEPEDDDELKFIKAKGRSFWSDDDDELGPKKAKKKTPKKKARKAPPAAEPAEPPAAEPEDDEPAEEDEPEDSDDSDTSDSDSSDSSSDSDSDGDSDKQPKTSPEDKKAAARAKFRAAAKAKADALNKAAAEPKASPKKRGTPKQRSDNFIEPFKGGLRPEPKSKPDDEEDAADTDSEVELTGVKRHPKKSKQRRRTTPHSQVELEVLNSLRKYAPKSYNEKDVKKMTKSISRHANSRAIDNEVRKYVTKYGLK